MVKVPEHAPPHPEKAYPGNGVSVSVTEVPEEYDAVQVEPQLIPDGALDTEPPVEVLTVSTLINGGGLGAPPEELPPQAVLSKTMTISMHSKALLKKTRRRLLIQVDNRDFIIIPKVVFMTVIRRCRTLSYSPYCEFPQEFSQG